MDGGGLRIGDRAAGYGDFLLLFRRRQLMASYARALSALGIPVSMDGEGFLLELPEVVDLFRYLRGCLHPEDRADTVGALRSAFCGVSDRQLAEHAQAGGGWSIFRDDGQTGVQAVRDALSRMKADFDILGSAAPALAFRRFFAKRAVRTLLAQCRGLYGIRVYEALLAFIDAEVPPTASPAEAADALWAAIMDGRKLDPLFVPFGESGHVRMLTVHRSKGLQAPVVVLCDVSDPERNRAPVVVPDRRSGKLFFTFRLEKRTGGGEWGKAEAFSVPSDGLDGVLAKEKAAAEAESVRLAYVAATRAQEYLVLPTYHGKPGALFTGIRSGLDGLPSGIPRPAALTLKLPAGSGGAPELPLPDILTSGAAPSEADRPLAETLRRESLAAQETIARAAAASVEHRIFSRLDPHERLEQHSGGYGPGYGTFSTRSCSSPSPPSPPRARSRSGRSRTCEPGSCPA